MVEKPSVRRVSVSLVSHGQGALAAVLLADLKKYSGYIQEVILTANIAEATPVSTYDFPFDIKVIHNPTPKGFGANHNAAFRVAGGDYFCVVNPDVRLTGEVFGGLIDCLQDPTVAIVAPVVCGSDGQVEDSARRFPRPWTILARAIGCRSARKMRSPVSTTSPDWVAGMFMLVPTPIFRRLGGFDEGYFLYYEDVDICTRARRLGYRVDVCPSVTVIHDARRQSHKEWRYLRWHLASMIRFFTSGSFFWSLIAKRLRVR